MNKTVYKRIAFIMLVILLLGILAPTIISLTSNAAGTEDELRGEISDITREKQRLQQKINAVRTEKNRALSAKNAIDTKIDSAEREIALTNQLITQLNASIALKETELAVQQQQINIQLDLFLDRMRVMEENGSATYISVLLGADSFTQFLARAEIMSEIMDYDKQLLAELRAAREVTARLQADLLAEKNEQAALRANLLVVKADLNQQYDAAETLVNDLAADEAAFRRAYEDAEREENSLKRQLNSLLSSSSNSTYVGGEFLWPVPGYTRISSYFGMRFHPVLKVNKLHTGIDIPAPKGTKTVAANSGKVVKAEYNNAYGNYVVIDHGGGKATLYGHFSKLSVSSGQNVNRGDKVGEIGTTGYSTGNHLHFEVIINGTAVNPLNYFK